MLIYPGLIVHILKKYDINMIILPSGKVKFGLKTAGVYSILVSVVIAVSNNQEKSRECDRTQKMLKIVLSGKIWCSTTFHPT